MWQGWISELNFWSQLRLYGFSIHLVIFTIRFLPFNVFHILPFVEPSAIAWKQIRKSMFAMKKWKWRTSKQTTNSQPQLLLITCSLFELGILGCVAHVALWPPRPINIATALEDKTNRKQSVPKYWQCYVGGLYHSIWRQNSLQKQSFIQITYVLHCQSFALKRPLLFSARVFPISVPPAFIIFASVVFSVQRGKTVSSIITLWDA